MPRQTNDAIVREINTANGISENERKAVTRLFLDSAQKPIQRLILKSIDSMNQDIQRAWITQKPKRPLVIRESLPVNADHHVRIAGIGGMAAYLNLLVHAATHGGSHCVITHPSDIFTFAAWTFHPEEDMDQRLVPMFQTFSLLVSEFRRMLGMAAPPQAPRFKAFKVDYAGALGMLIQNPREILKLIRVNAQYVAGEFMGVAEHFAHLNLKRNRTTLDAFRQLGCIGNRQAGDILNLPGRVVFEITDEPTDDLKKQLKSQYRLTGERLSAKKLETIYGDRIRILEDIHNGTVRPVLYPGGYFLPGFKDNALNLASEKGARVYDQARVTRIGVDKDAGKCAVFFESGSVEKIVIADSVIMAVGDYGDDIIPIDGVSTLFVIRTENSAYRLFPTGMGEGGTVHIVPVDTIAREENGTTLYYHLGKATNGAIVGRDPLKPKQLYKDVDFILHIEAGLNKIMPAGATLTWITATECGRPVVAQQSYRTNTLSMDPLLIDIAGGCGLGGNTPIIPEVQAALSRTTQNNA